MRQGFPDWAQRLSLGFCATMVTVLVAVLGMSCSPSGSVREGLSVVLLGLSIPLGAVVGLVVHGRCDVESPRQGTLYARCCLAALLCAIVISVVLVFGLGFRVGSVFAYKAAHPLVLVLRKVDAEFDKGNHTVGRKAIECAVEGLDEHRNAHDIYDRICKLIAREQRAGPSDGFGAEKPSEAEGRETE
ncbi:MAG: hypothetical protein ACYTFI_09330 [Planctomycetota bacterium]